MGPLKSFAKEAGLVAATTLGAGTFALPFVFLKAGWLTGLFYLATLAAIIVSVHILYLRVLEKVNKKNGLLGLARAYLGKLGFAAGLFAISGGLILTLVVYLILGGEFVQLLFPSFSSNPAILIFWIVSTLPLLFKERRSLNSETLGIILIAGIIFFIFSTSDILGGTLSQISAFNWRSAFLPFGAILFALAGWTSVEPVFDIEKRSKSELTPTAQPSFALAAGTAIAAVLYVVFVTGIFGSSGAITPDTISGLFGWPKYKLVLLAVLGLFAIWTSYLPIGLEIKHSFENDLRLRRSLSLGLVIFLPLILLFLGLNNFARVVGLVGGVFLSLQYLLIVSVGKKALQISGVKGFLLNIVSLVFVLAAVYEIYYFIVK